MERKLVTIREIKAIDSIPNSDNIDVATVDGWQVIVKKGEFKVGDKCAFFEIDSFLPIKPQYEFLRKSSYKKFFNGVEGLRLRTIKLRGVVSQGLVLPLPVLKLRSSLKVGTDVTEKLGVQKYEPELLGQAHLKKSWISRKYNQIKWFVLNLFMTKEQRTRQTGSFPTGIIRKTDEERIQNLGINRFQGQKYEVTEKLDGCSCTVAYFNEQFYVCSRNNKLGLRLGENSQPTGPFDGAYWKMALKYDLENKLKEYSVQTGDFIAIQGEIVGPGIQKNKYCLSDFEFYVYKIWCINKQIFVDAETRRQICNQMGLCHVPVLETSLLFEFKEVEDVLKYAEAKSRICDTQEREGVVFKEVSGEHSFKVISNKFLLKHEE